MTLNPGQETRPSNNKLRKELIISFAVPAEYRAKIRMAKRWEKCFDFSREQIKHAEKHESDDDTYGSWCPGNRLQSSGKSTDRSEEESKPYRPDHCQKHTNQSLGYLMRFVVVQTSV